MAPFHSWREAGRLARLLACALLAVFVTLTAWVPVARASAGPLEYPSGDTYVFGDWIGTDGTVYGFAVADEEGITFHASYQALGGRAVLGPAISHRHPCGDSVCQAFERGLLRWEPDGQEARLVDVLAYLHHTGKDPLLEGKLGIPAPWDWSERDAGKEWADVFADHEGLFNASEKLAATRERLGSLTSAIIGLPVAVGPGPKGIVLRGTRGALVEPTGLLASQSPYVLGAGRIAAAIGMVPDWALEPARMPASTAEAPALLRIPKLGIEQSLLALDPAEDGSLPVPEAPEDVAWYTDSARLGESGNMLMAGHVDWVGRTAVFRHLDTLAPGDEVWVHDAHGTPTRFVVEQVGRYRTADGDLRRLMANDGRGPHTLTLVTCGGPFDVRTGTYLERVVVRAVPVG